MTVYEAAITDGCVMIRLHSTIAERLRSFLQAHDVGEDQILYPDVYFPLLEVLRDQLGVEECSEQDFDHCFRATIRRQEEELSEENTELKAQNELFWDTIEVLQGHKRGLERACNEQVHRFNKEKAQLLDEIKELSDCNLKANAKVEYLEGCVEQREETLEKLREVFETLPFKTALEEGSLEAGLGQIRLKMRDLGLGQYGGYEDYEVTF